MAEILPRVPAETHDHGIKAGGPDSSHITPVPSHAPHNPPGQQGNHSNFSNVSFSIRMAELVGSANCSE